MRAAIAACVTMISNPGREALHDYARMHLVHGATHASERTMILLGGTSADSEGRYTGRLLMSRPETILQRDISGRGYKQAKQKTKRALF